MREQQVKVQGAGMAAFEVATFWHPDLRCKVLCYLRDYNPRWDGCVMFHVEAKNGAAAKREAAQMRKELEESRNAQ